MVLRSSGGQSWAVSTALAHLFHNGVSVSSDVINAIIPARTTCGARTNKVRYEGYGPGGAAVLIECVTHDCETATALRGLFARHGGHLGAQGAVAYLFNAVGILTYAPSAQLAGRAFAAGAEDVLPRDDALVEVITDPLDFDAVGAALARSGHVAMRALITQRAANTVELRGPPASGMRGLLQELAQHPSVQDIYTNARLAE